MSVYMLNYLLVNGHFLGHPVSYLDIYFFRKKIEKNTIIAFYNGIRILPNSSESKTWDEDGYKIFDPSTKPNGTIDIPTKFRELSNYSASLAHKTNHSFIPNTEFVVFDHPR